MSPYLYRVYMSSVPGFWARYEGYVDIWAEDENGARDKGPRELRRTSFPDRPIDAWRINSIERIK